MSWLLFKFLQISKADFHSAVVMTEIQGRKRGKSFGRWNLYMKRKPNITKFPR